MKKMRDVEGTRGVFISRRGSAMTLPLFLVMVMHDQEPT